MESRGQGPDFHAVPGAEPAFEGSAAGLSQGAALGSCSPWEYFTPDLTQTGAKGKDKKIEILPGSFNHR